MTTPTKDVSRISPPATRSTSSAQGLLLKKQMELVVGGNGGAPATDCHASLMKLVRAGHPIEKPLAWVSSPENDAEVRLLDYAALCLYQFPEGEKAEVTVLVGDRSYTVPVAPESAEYPAEPADSALFDGRAVQTDDGADALRESADWIFFPPNPAREAVALDGSMTVTARAGDVRTSIEVPVHVPMGGTHFGTWEEQPDLIVHGFPAGSRVPIGLYRIENFTEATLERTIGTVTMPPSRIAFFTVPGEVVRMLNMEATEKLDYCVAVPGGDCSAH
ncbi:hypothetical protein [Streptomyces sp. NBC_01353]|uniref:hypothetical protein n=1 Tax=Streptomyces sp. NBC_01353 TaxID=2903835 RepID=UPI002E30B208|nr:hypothetical protein [Streptomyces sp. NBC_01353]